MKYQLTFKTPDVLDQMNDELNDAGAEVIADAEALANKFIQYGEYITVEFDTKTSTAKVVPL